MGVSLGLSAKAVSQIGRRYIDGGLERASFDASRPGRAPGLDQQEQQRIIAVACSPPPEGRSRWTVRLLTEEVIRRKLVPRVGRETIRILLESHDLKQPGQVARRDYEYERYGTANVFCGIELKAGIHFTKVTPTRASTEFADLILEIAAHYSAADTIHLVMDNLSTHTRRALVDRFGSGGRMVVGSFYRSLHAKTWKLAQPG